MEWETSRADVNIVGIFGDLVDSRISRLRLNTLPSGPSRDGRIGIEGLIIGINTRISPRKFGEPGIRIVGRRGGLLFLDFSLVKVCAEILFGLKTE